MEKMNKTQVLALVKELKIEKGKIQYVPHYYKRNGQMVRRYDDDMIYTARYDELIKILDDDSTRIFKCADCGKMCTYFELESWCCDFEKDEYVCDCCYESSQGEDL